MTGGEVAVRHRIRWRSRRGLLELDLLLERFLAQRLDSLIPSELLAYCRLLDLPDYELLDIVNGRVELENDGDAMAIVAMLHAT